MIYTLTFNPAVDLYINKKDNYFLPGGKGINVSKFLKSFDVNSICLGFVGGKTGEYIKKQLNKNKIKNDFVVTSNPTRINMKINFGNEVEVNGKSQPISLKEYKELKVKLLKLKANDVLVVSGSFTNDLNFKWFKSILDILLKRNVKFVFDTSNKLLLKLCKYKPLFVKPNIDELSSLFNSKIKNDKQIITNAKKLIKLGAQNVLVSLGSKGAILVTKNSSYKLASPKGKVITTVGAGDCMVASFLYKFLKTNDLKESFAFSVKTSSAYVFSNKIANK